jgi:glycosyltransferase involved in cell wall biosynthesis
LREQYNFKDTDFILNFVGHEFERKGLAHIIEALPHLPEKVKLVVLGGRASNEDTYKALASKLQVNHRVHFYGTRDDVHLFYNMSDLFVLPSAYETFALVGLEAMACGIPALMTPFGGILEYLKDNENGCFINQSYEDIVAKVSVYISSPDLYAQCCSNAYATAVQWDWSKIGERYIDEVHRVALSKEKL